MELMASGQGAAETVCVSSPKAGALKDANESSGDCAGMDSATVNDGCSAFRRGEIIVPKEVINPPNAKLPSLSHLSRSTYDNVYEPAEDTYLMVDTLHAEDKFLYKLKPAVCLEVGSGSGCLSAALSQVLTTYMRKVVSNDAVHVNECPSHYRCTSDWPGLFLCTDCNLLAAKASRSTLAANGTPWSDCIRTDLVTGLLPRLKSQVDVMLFNPPYVITPSEEINESDIARSWAGGIDGREVLDRLLPDIPELLSFGGVLYLIAIEENHPEQICTILRELGMRHAFVLSRRRAMNERLMVIKAIK